MRFPSPTSLRRAAAFGACLTSAAFAGCSKEFYTGVPDPDRVELSILPRVINVNNGSQATGLAYDGSRIVNHPRVQVTYRSENTAVAVVNTTNGSIVGLSPGVAYIVATAGDESARDSVIVRLTPARSVLFAVRNPRFRVNALNSLAATPFDSANNPIRDRIPQYRSTNEAVLTIASNGVVTPRAVGTAQLIATVDNGLGGGGSVADTVTATVALPPISNIQVTPTLQQLTPGQTQQYTATLTDSINSTVTGRPVIWTSSAPGVITVDRNSGFATAVSVGSATISATVDYTAPGDPDNRPVSNGTRVDVVQARAVSVTPSPRATALVASGTRSAAMASRVRDVHAIAAVR